MLKNVPSTGFAELLVNAGDGPTLITNMDTNATLVLGKDNSVLAKTISGGFQTGGDISLIHPSGSRIVDGKTAVYGIGTQASGTILVDVHQGAEAAPASATEIVSQLVLSTLPALVAAAVKAAGVPPIDNPAVVEVIFNHTIAAGASFNPGHFSVGQFQSWFATMFCTATNSGLGTAPYTKFEMQWSVATDNFDPLITHDWVVPNTPFNFFYNYRNDCQGPVFGDTLDMTWTNYDTQPVNVTIGIFGSFRTRARPKLTGRYHYITGTGAPDETRGLGSDNVVDIFNPSGIIAPGNQSNADLMNLVSGPATVSGNAVFAGAGAANFNLIINPQPASILAAAIQVPVRATVAGLALTAIMPPVQIQLPRRVCTIAVQNDPSSASNISSAQFVVTSQEQPE